MAPPDRVVVLPTLMQVFVVLPLVSVDVTTAEPLTVRDPLTSMVLPGASILTPVAVELLVPGPKAIAQDRLVKSQSSIDTKVVLAPPA